MAELLTLARPYAKAAFDHASENKSLDSWSTSLSLAAQVVEDSQFADYLARADITQPQQAAAVLQAMGGNQPTDFANFTQLLASNHRLALFPAISEEFEVEKAKALNITEVTIESAFALTAEQQQMFAEKLAKRFGSGVNIKTVVNPSLIAGAIIRVGDQVIDDSAAGKLSKLRNSLLA